MNPRRWGEVRALFEQVVDLAPDERSRRLEARCAGDLELRRAVEQMLAGDRVDAGPLNRPLNAWVVPGTSPSVEAVPPERLGPYRIERELGRGGMGIVYEAVRDDAQLRKRVALKWIRQGLDSADVLRRFQLEREILGRLQHPHIAQIHDAGTTEDGRPYFAMEYVEGQPIDVFGRERKLDLDARLALFDAVCRAVHYAHQNLVAHRDLKPSNVLVTADGQVKLLDFGIAKLLEPSAGEAAPLTTDHWQRRFTPAYASPEQIRGQAMTTASDLYSLGVLLFEMISGERPYDLDGLSPAELERVVVEQPPPRPSEVAAGMSGRLSGAVDLDSIVHKAMAKAPQARYASVEDLREDLQRYRQGLPVLARDATPAYRLAKFLRRHKFAAALFVAALLFAGAMGLLSVRLAGSLETSRQALAVADRQTRTAESTSALLVDLFRQANPRGPRGGELSLREVLDAATERLHGESEQAPEVRAALMDAIGRVNVDLGRVDQAESLFQEALRLRRELHGERHPDVATSLAHLGLARRERQDPASEGLIREALQLRRELLPDDAPELSESLTHLGVLLFRSGRAGEAEAPLQEALERRRRQAEDDATVAESLSNLASVRLELGKVDQAVDGYAQAVAIYESTLGPNHPDLAVALQNLGLARYRAGHIAEAGPMLQRSAEILATTLGPDHRQRLAVLSNLAGRALDVGDLDQAQRWAAEVVDRQASAGAPPGVVSTSRRLLARVLQQQRRYDEAERVLRQALADLRTAGSEPVSVATTRVALGSLLLEAGRVSEAESILRPALTARRGFYPVGDRRIALAENLLAASLAEQQRWQEAEVLFASSLPVVRGAYAQGHRLRRRAEARVERFCDGLPASARPEFCRS